MKKHLLIIMLLSLSTLLSAQEAKKFLTEGKVWKCVTSNYSPLHDEGDTPFTVKVVGDTICEGRTMKKLHIEYEEGVKGFYSRYIGAYEEGGRLHAYDSDNDVGPDIILIDMNLKVGDPILGGSCHVSAVDTICVDGIARKRITIGNDAQSAIIWVEGIGSSRLMVHPNYQTHRRILDVNGVLRQRQEGVLQHRLLSPCHQQHQPADRRPSQQRQSLRPLRTTH